MGKDKLRTELLRRRRDMSTAVRTVAAEAIALHLLAAPVISSARRIACYVSMASEPGTGPLIAGLIDRGIEVIVPRTVGDETLDWVTYDPAARTTRTALGIVEPEGEPLGGSAIDECALIVVPALAVDHAGQRLGRGAGYYDRALVAVTRPLCALVFTHELLEFVPHEPHDIPVSMAVTPDGLFRVP